jgi:hypothetical protein
MAFCFRLVLSNLFNSLRWVAALSSRLGALWPLNKFGPLKIEYRDLDDCIKDLDQIREAMNIVITKTSLMIERLCKLHRNSIVISKLRFNRDYSVSKDCLDEKSHDAATAGL